MRRLMVGLAGVMLVAGCSSSGGGIAGAPPSSEAVSTVSTPAATPTPMPVDPNIAACSEVQAYVSNEVAATFDAYDPDADEFDTKFSTALREEGTHLFGLAGKATGEAASAIHDEATGLVNISVAIENEDDSAVGDASNAANTALAALRGACHF